jgi:hypothetical protein
MKKIFAIALLAAGASCYTQADEYQNPNTPPPPPPNQTYSTQTYATPSTGSAADPQAGHIGVGITLGEPVGVDAKYWVNDTMAIDGAAGWSDDSHSDFYVHGDVLWHKFNLINFAPDNGKLPVYFGVGGLFRARSGGRSNDVGVRAPIGVDYIFNNVPIDIFAEIGPAIDVAPDIHGEITGGIGVRFWF